MHPDLIIDLDDLQLSTWLNSCSVSVDLAEVAALRSVVLSRVTVMQHM
jgi:hypothetical protein